MRLLIRGLLSFWMHLHRVGVEIGHRRAARHTKHYVTELDARTLKDIGLEPWRSALGAEVASRRSS